MCETRARTLVGDEDGENDEEVDEDELMRYIRQLRGVHNSVPMSQEKRPQVRESTEMDNKKEDFL